MIALAEPVTGKRFESEGDRRQEQQQQRDERRLRLSLLRVGDAMAQQGGQPDPQRGEAKSGQHRTVVIGGEFGRGSGQGQQDEGHAPNVG